MMLRKFVLFLFVLIQGVAPLVHAHAGTSQQGGIHMPEACAAGESHDHEPHAQAGDESPVFTVDISLGARNSMSLPGEPALSRRLAGDHAHSVLRWIPIAVHEPDPFRSHYLFSLPCAPPSA